MSWQIFLLFNIIAYSFSFIIQKGILKNSRIDPIAYSITFSIAAGIMMILYSLPTGGFSLAHMGDNLHNVFFMIILNTLGNIFMFKSLKLVEASEFTILFTSRALWSIFAAIIFLGEKFTMQQFVGTLLVIVSIGIVSWKPAKYKLSKGELYALLASFCFGFSFINDAIILQETNVPSYLSLAFILPAISLLMIFPKTTGKVKVLFEPQVFVKLLVVAFLFSSSVVAVFYAYKAGNNAAQISALGQITTIVTVILAFIFLGERHSMLRKVIGTVICFAGVLLVT